MTAVRERAEPEPPVPAAVRAVTKAAVVPTPAERLAAALGGDVATAIGGDTAPPVDWHWHGIIARGDAAELSGKSTTGKSTLSFLLAVASVSPEPIELCGHLVTPLSPEKIVLLVNVEQRKASVGRKLTEAAAVLGVPEAALDRIVVAGRELEATFQDEQTWAKILSERDAIGLIVLDSRARLFRGDGDKEGDQSDAARQIGMLTKKGATCLVISHVRKGGGYENAPLTIEDVAGSLQRGAGADCILLVSARKSATGEVLATTIQVAKRRDDGGEEHPQPMVFAIERAGGKPTLVYGNTATAKAAEPAPTARIFALLHEQGARTENAIAKQLGMSKPTVCEVLIALKRSGRVKKSTAIVRGRNREVWTALTDAVLQDAGVLAKATRPRSTVRARNKSEPTFRAPNDSASNEPQNQCS